MNLRGTTGKATTVAMAVGVAAAEGASFVYFMFTPWFLSPGDRSMYCSIGFNVLLFLLMNRLSEKGVQLRSWQDALAMSVYFTLIYTAIQAPYVITWWNPMSYTYLIGPVAHTLVQTGALAGALWYFKTKR